MASTTVYDLYRIERCSIRANEGFSSNAGSETRELACSITVKPRLLTHDAESARRQLVLSLRVDATDEQLSALPYFIEVVARLYFHVDSASSPDRRDVLSDSIRVAIGMLRGHIATETSVGVNGQFILPELDIADIAEDFIGNRR